MRRYLPPPHPPDRAAIQSLSEKLVFNCTSLGAKTLFDYAELTPVKGQLMILLPQPEIQYAAIAGDTYMFPRSDGIVRRNARRR